MWCQNGNWAEIVEIHQIKVTYAVTIFCYLLTMNDLI